MDSTILIQVPNNLSLNWLKVSFLVLFVSGCQSLGVESWQRDKLSQPAMQFQARDQELTTDDHFYFSKEGTSGGRGFAGGGCGCN